MPRRARDLCVIAAGALLVVGFTSVSASELTAGKKALFAEDFELDIYEWTLAESGAEEGEDPDLITTDDAYQGRNALQLSGKKGILALELTERIEGFIEFQVRFSSSPRDYTRMFAVGLDDEEVLLGVNRSDSFAYVTGGVWHTSDIQVGDGWHTFTYDFSAGITRLYIDGTLVTTTAKPGAFEWLRLGVNNGRGGRCLVDEVVIAAADPELSDSETVEVEIPLMGWDEEFLFPTAKVGSEVTIHGNGSFRITDAVTHSGAAAAELSYGASGREDERCHYLLRRTVPLPGLPRKLSLWVNGDNLGATLSVEFGTENSSVTYRLPPITWSGWRQLEIDLTEEADSFYPPLWDWVIKKASYEGTVINQMYLTGMPVGREGAIQVDDLVLTTRLNNEFPYFLHVENTAEDNIVVEGARGSVAREADASMEFDLLLGNYSAEDAAFTVEYSLENYWGETVHRGQLDLAAAAGGKATGRVAIEKPSPPHGWYLARFALIDGDRTIATATEPVAVLRPLDKSLFSEANPLGNYGGHTRQGHKVGLAEVYLGGPGDLRDADNELLRRWRPDPEELARLETHNYSGIIFYMVPPWAFLPEEELHVEAQKAADALAEMAADLKGLPVYYKILSEPNNSGISPERCYLVLKYAAEGLWRGDPDARVIGLNTSKFDWGRQKVVWGLGGLKYVHAVGVHPYCGAHHGSVRPERVHGIGNLKSMLRLDDMIRHYNNGEPRMIWASEVGYDTGGVTWQQQADFMARMIIEFKTLENFGKVHSHLIQDGVFGQFGIFTRSTQPKPVAVSFHGLVERMTGVRWLKSLETTDNVRAYLFEQGTDGRQMLTAWSVEGTDELTLPVQCGTVETMDLMGVYGSLETDNGQLSLQLTESPVFVSPAEDGELLFDRWVQAQTRYKEVGVGQRGRAVRVVVTNEGSDPLRGTLVGNSPEGLSLSPANRQVDLGPGEEMENEFILSVAADCPSKLYEIPFALRSDEEIPAVLARTTATISVALPEIELGASRVNRAPVIDGKLDDEVWNQAKEITGFADDTQGFVPDVKQSLRLLYDLDGIYVGTRYQTVPDQELRAEHTQRDDANLWRDECVEVFLDPDFDRSTYYQFVANIKGVQSDLRIVDSKMKPRDWDEARLWNGRWRVATAEGSDHWSAEAFIPWETVGVEAGAKQRMGLNVSRKYAPVGDPVIHSYTPAGVPVHGVESYLPVDVDLTP